MVQWYSYLELCSVGRQAYVCMAASVINCETQVQIFEDISPETFALFHLIEPRLGISHRYKGLNMVIWLQNWWCLVQDTRWRD